MIFETETYPVQPLISEADASETRALEGNFRTENKTPSIRQKDKDDDFFKDSQISNWENEGGAYSDRVNAILRNRGVNSGSDLTAHLTILSGNYRPSGAALPPHLKALPLEKPHHQITP